MVNDVAKHFEGGYTEFTFLNLENDTMLSKTFKDGFQMELGIGARQQQIPQILESADITRLYPKLTVDKYSACETGNTNSQFVVGIFEPSVHDAGMSFSSHRNRDTNCSNHHAADDFSVAEM
ncbi:hypothetical protein T265_15729, partial [Opisthorchis viverrini]